MKKLTILGVLLLSVTILISCGDEKKSAKNKKKDKFKKEIKEPCDLFDYQIEVLKDLYDLADDYDDIDELEDDKKDKKKKDKYFDDLLDAYEYSFKKFGDDFSDCKQRGAFNAFLWEGNNDKYYYYYEKNILDFGEKRVSLVKKYNINTNIFMQQGYDDDDKEENY